LCGPDHPFEIQDRPDQSCGPNVVGQDIALAKGGLPEGLF
jgi:hypothetical protein